MKEIRSAIVGIGNCASALVQGKYYYANIDGKVPGLITQEMGGYRPGDLQFVAAFDVDERKVDISLNDAIFAPPNCTTVFQKDLPVESCLVEMGYTIDSIASQASQFPEPSSYKPKTNIYGSEAEAKEAIVESLKRSKAEVLVSYLPVGSEKNTLFYADCAIEAGCAFVNAVPVFVSKTYADKFRLAGLPILGDDIKSQIGATIIHRVLAKLFEDRGMPLRRTYQLNVGGNTDFMTMLDRNRLKDKKKSKTQSVTSQMQEIEEKDVHIGPSDYIPWLNDNKVAFVRIEAEQFGGVPMDVELRLSVEDSPNSAGVMMDAIRAAKVALDRGLAGPIVEASAYLFKSPVEQYDDSEAREMLKRFAEDD